MDDTRSASTTNSALRLGIVVLAFAGVLLLLNFLDSTPDDAGLPLAAGLGIVGLLLVAVGAAKGR